MLNQNFIICLTGLPASGKTTFANKLKRILEKRLNEFVVKIIDPDKIRQLVMANKFDHKKESLVRENNLNAIRREIQEGHIVISDDLNYYTSMRHDIKEIADDFNIKFFIIHVDTPLEICIKWNKTRGKLIPNKIIKRIQKKFDPFNKYNWDLPEARYDLSQIQDINVEIEDLIDRLMEKLKIPESTFEEKEQVKSYSNLDNEQLDKLTRIYVGKLLQNSNYLHLKKKIIKIRKLFVRLYRNKSLQKPELSKAFKDYLEKNLNLKIPEELF